MNSKKDDKENIHDKIAEIILKILWTYPIWITLILTVLYSLDKLTNGI